ncbi:MAG: hypothetical protein ABS938_18305 [Psychrobacillus psychrodurans]
MSKTGIKTKVSTTQYDRSGGFNEAVKEFEALQPKIYKDTPDLKIDKLPEGRTVNVRKISSSRDPTLEIQDGIKRIKFRYK